MYLYHQQSPSNLGFYRPNEAVARGIYGRRYLSGLGQDVSTNFPTLILGIGALAFGMYMLGEKRGPGRRAKHRARLRRKLSRLDELGI
jgi:hypothetical protein